MDDPRDTVISGLDCQQIVTAMNRIMPLLDPEVRRRLNAVKLAYVVAYGVDGLYERVNGRSVAQILAEYQEPEGRTILAEGEVDGVRFTLYDRPPEPGEPGNPANRPGG